MDNCNLWHLRFSLQLWQAGFCCKAKVILQPATVISRAQGSIKEKEVEKGVSAGQKVHFQGSNISGRLLHKQLLETLSGRRSVASQVNIFLCFTIYHVEECTQPSAQSASSSLAKACCILPDLNNMKKRYSFAAVFLQFIPPSVIFFFLCQKCPRLKNERH